jgi:hypothetical protein
MKFSLRFGEIHQFYEREWRFSMIKVILSSLVLVSLVACQSNTPETSVVDGIQNIDSAGLVLKSEMTTGQSYYISSDQVNIRTSPEVTPNNLGGRLMKDDEVQVLDILAGQGKWIKVKIISTKAVLTNPSPEQIYYLSYEFINARRSDYQDPAIISNRASIIPGELLYVAWSVVNVRSAAKSENGNVIGQIFKNDTVRIISAAPELGDFVQVEVTNSQTHRQEFGKAAFVGLKALSRQPAQLTASEVRARQVVVIQNLATEVTRVYEKCDMVTNPNCNHKLIFQTRMVVGRLSKEKDSATGQEKVFNTWAGDYRIMSWIKFYEDGQKHYPSWWAPNYPELPKPGSNPLSWLNKKYFPAEYQDATARGAFGWFAGLVTPNSNEQWLHGTYGWGADKDAALKWTRNFVANVVSNPRSSGCTRHDNESIAYIRHIAPVGTQVIRVYALEGYRDVFRKDYADSVLPGAWNYTLTKESPRTVGATIDAERVHLDGLAEDQILERGTLQVHKFPVAIPRSGFKNAFARQTSENGDIYRVGKNGFRGVFLVDQAKFIDYSHPDSITVGGLGERTVPAFLRAPDTLFEKNYFVPKWKPFANEKLNQPKIPKTEADAKEEAERPT